MTTANANLFRNIPPDLTDELAEFILIADSLRIERIVSQGHTSPDNFWYDQDQDEWVVLLAGSAVIEFEDNGEKTSLTPGDYLNIPAHRRHRVNQTAASEQTIWLAVHYPRNP